MSINSRIKERREELEMSRQELADKIGQKTSSKRTSILIFMQ